MEFARIRAFICIQKIGLVRTLNAFANTAETAYETTVAIAAPVVADLPQSVPHNVPEEVSLSDNSILFLSSAAPSESWFAGHKYILGALLVVAIVIGAMVWLR